MDKRLILGLALVLGLWWLKQRADENSEVIMAQLLKKSGNKFFHPLDKSVRIVRTAPFDQDRGSYRHAGTDYQGDPQSDLVAFTDGEVVQKKFQPDGGGHYIVIKHPGLLPGAPVLHVVYMHMMEASPLNEGDKVEAGQFVGRQGNTGHVKGHGTAQGHLPGEHLHVEARKNNWGEKMDFEKLLAEVGIASERLK